MVEKKCYNIFQPDAVMTGGIAHTLEVARHCRRHGLGFTPHTWTNGIGFGVNLNVLLASGFTNEKPLEFPLNPPSWTVDKRDGILKRPYTHEKGVFYPTYDPGLGFEIDRRALLKYGDRFFTMNRRKLSMHTIKDKGFFTAMKLKRNKKRYGVESVKKAE